MSKLLNISIALLLLFGATALADWDEGDSHKMHYPQLPDENGWDVNMHAPFMLADDWRCSHSGVVGNIHIWFSDRYNIGPEIEESVSVAIYSNVEAGVDSSYSHPGNLLWNRTFDGPSLQSRMVGQGIQGWYAPDIPFYNPFDHENIFQVNIMDISDPFYQLQGQIYWLAVTIDNEDIFEPTMGWKTSLDHFMDEATWIDWSAGIPQWRKLNGGPMDLDRVDLAFVVDVPEPATLAVLMLAGLPMLIRRR